MKAGLSVLCIGSPVLCGKEVFYEHFLQNSNVEILLLKIQLLLDNGYIGL